MPLLQYDGSELLFRTEDREELLTGKHRLFVSSVIGFSYDETDKVFRIPHPKNPSKLIERLGNYLSKNSIPYRLDKGAQWEFDSLQNDRELLATARDKGLQVKNDQYGAFDVPGFERNLMDYQRVSVKHIVEVPYSANFSVPGSGKTTIALAAYSILHERGTVKKLLVIGPRSSFRPWEDEFEGCFGKKPESLRIVGTPDRRRFLLRTTKDVDLYLVTYQMAVNEADELATLLRTSEFLLILDESHYIKNFEGGVWSENVLELGRLAKRRLILTGTPAPNNFNDLWSQFTFLWPSMGLLGERVAFKAQVEQPDSSTLMKERLRPFFCRIKKSDLQLPKPEFEIVRVDMNDNQRIIYNALSADILNMVTQSPEERAELRAWKKAEIIRLLQTASNPTLLSLYSDEFRLPPLESKGLPITELIHKYPQFEVPAKFEKAEQLVRQAVTEGEKVIVWTWFVHNIDMLRKRLADLNPLWVMGEVPKDNEEDDSWNRELILDQFRTDPKSRVLLANPAATAESISLHKICHKAIYLDRTFNCGQYLQSLDRIHRVGLGPDEIVRYQIMVANDTVDEVVNERLNVKIERMSNLLDDDLPILDLEQPTVEVTGLDSELDQDFDEVIDHLKSHQPGPE